MAEQSPKQTVEELRVLVVAYFRQEALDPLRNLGRYLGFGLAGGLLLGIGVTCLGVGALRALQSETGTTFHDNWSWAPYALVAVALVAFGAIAWRLRPGRSEQR